MQALPLGCSFLFTPIKWDLLRLRGGGGISQSLLSTRGKLDCEVLSGMFQKVLSPLQEP